MMVVIVRVVFLTYFLEASERDLLSSIASYLPDNVREPVKFFIASIKIKFKDYQWEFGGGFMGSKHVISLLTESTKKSNSS